MQHRLTRTCLFRLYRILHKMPHNRWRYVDNYCAPGFRKYLFNGIFGFSGRIPVLSLGLGICHGSRSQKTCSCHCGCHYFFYFRNISQNFNREHLSGIQNASMIPKNDCASRAAPPIRPPSTSGFAKSSLALVGLQLPP